MEAADRTKALATPGRQQVHCKLAGRQRFDLDMETQAIRKQDCRPAKKP
jgi:hypothetical protein